MRPQRGGLIVTAWSVKARMADVDVQIHGADPVATALAATLAAEGVRVRVVDAEGGHRGRHLVALPVHPEPPHHFVAALGPGRARALVEWAAVTGDGVDWRCPGAEAAEVGPALAALAELGLPTERTVTGFRIYRGGTVELPAFVVHATPVEAEIDVLASAWPLVDGWLAEKLTPVRHHVRDVPGLLLARPEVSRRATVWATDGRIAGARWAEAHSGVGDADVTPCAPAVLDALDRVALADHGLHATGGHAVRVLESCDGLPILGSVPGRPRVVALTGFGFATGTWGPSAVRAVAAGILGKGQAEVPAALRAGRFRGG